MANTIHYDEIRRTLTARRRELLNEIQNNLRDARSAASVPNRYPVESGETGEAYPEDELAFALMQMKSQVLRKIEEAMRQLDEGIYGICGDCGDAISAPRLRALPFAVRCKECEEMLEHAEQRERVLSRSQWQLC
jgi:DnaK suppressor protein